MTEYHLYLLVPSFKVSARYLFDFAIFDTDSDEFFQNEIDSGVTNNDRGISNFKS